VLFYLAAHVQLGFAVYLQSLAHTQHQLAPNRTCNLDGTTASTVNQRFTASARTTTSRPPNQQTVQQHMRYRATLPSGGLHCTVIHVQGGCTVILLFIW
jgi:hypothetical protein